MTYKVYMTIELPERYASKEDAMDAAVKELQDAVQRQVDMPLRWPNGVRFFSCTAHTWSSVT